MADSENKIEDHESTNGDEIGNESFSELLILSEVESSDEEISNANVKSTCESEIKNNPIDMNVVSSVSKNVEDGQSNKDNSPKHSSEGDDFDLDDVIEEFAKEESKIPTLNDELDSLVDEFVEAECSTPKPKEAQVNIVLSDSDDDMLILDNIKAANSDDECVIVEDNRNEIIIRDDDEPQKLKLSNAIPAQAIEPQSNDNQSLVNSSVSDIQIPVTIGNAVEKCDSEGLSNSATATSINTPEQIIVNMDSSESQITLHVLLNSDHNTDKKLSEAVDSGNSETSRNLICVEKDKSCDKFVDIVEMVQCSNKEPFNLPHDVVDLPTSIKGLHDVSKQTIETLDTNEKIYITITDDGKANLHGSIDRMKSDNLKSESHLGHNSIKLCYDLSNEDTSIVVNENLNLNIDETVLTDDKNHEVVDFVPKDNKDIENIDKKCNKSNKDIDVVFKDDKNIEAVDVISQNNKKEDIDVVSKDNKNIEDVDMISKVNKKEHIDLISKENKKYIDVISKGNKNEDMVSKNNQNNVPVISKNIKNSEAIDNISEDSKNNDDIDKICKYLLEDLLKIVIALDEATPVIENSINTLINDQNQAELISDRDVCSRTFETKSKSSPSSVSQNEAEEKAVQRNDKEVLERKGSLSTNENKVILMADITCASSDSLHRPVSLTEVGESFEENSENVTEFFEHSSKSDAVNLVSEAEAVNITSISISDISPCSNTAEKSENKDVSVIEILEDSISNIDEDNPEAVSISIDDAVNKTGVSNSDSSPKSVCQNVVANCSPKKSESDGIEIIDASTFGEEEGGQDELIIDLINCIKKSMPEPIIEQVKSPIPLSDEALNDSKKRKIDYEDDLNSGKVIKKIRDEDSTEIEIASADSMVDSKVKETMLKLIPEKETFKVKTKKKYLDRIARNWCLEITQALFIKECTAERETIKDLEEKLQTLDEDLMLYKTQASELVTAQQEAFQQHEYNPQVQSRTVGANVKIFRECDIAPNKAPVNNIAALLNQEKSSTVLSVLKDAILARPPVPINFKPRPLLAPREQIQQVRYQSQSAPPPRMSVPKVLTRANLPLPRFYPVAPNVTMTGNPLAVAAPGMTRFIAARPGPMTTNVRASSSSNVIDLTDDEFTAANKKVLPPGTNISKVNLPAVSGNQHNVLVPFGGIFHVVPQGQGQPMRQTLVPSLPTGLGKKTVSYACIVPNNTVATRPSAVVPTSNRFQLLVQVPNQGSAPNKIVSAPTRFVGPPTMLNVNASQSSTSVHSAPLSNLLLIPRAPVHPAPFPPIPNYAPNSKLKCLPPKPSLKGSKAPNGIILSWNMSLYNSHAEVTNYQLFAYQETAGPVTASLWKKVGDVKALPLPMACTLTQFVEGHRYFFTVRAVDTYSRVGPFSDPVSIMYTLDKTPNSK